MVSWKTVFIISVMFLAAMTAIAVLEQSFAIAFIGFGIAIPMTYISKTRSIAQGEMASDEMVWKVAGDASLLTVSILMPAFAIVSVALIIAGDSLGEWSEYVGFTLSFVVLAFGLMYMAISLYKGWRLGQE